MIRHGLISNIDAETIEKTLQLVLDNFTDGTIHTCEVGILDGSTSIGIHDFVVQNGRKNIHTGIDNEQYQLVKKPFPECNLILGDSKYVYNQLADESQHFLFIDGNHNFPSVIADYFCYSPKVKRGGYLGFHDTASHIKDFLDYQHFGDKDDKDMYISVRRALNKIGLIAPQSYIIPNSGGKEGVDYVSRVNGWELVFDECDPNDTAGGVCIFKKL